MRFLPNLQAARRFPQQINRIQLRKIAEARRLATMSSDGPTAGGSFLASLRSAFQISNYWYPGTGREKAQDAESKLLARASTPDGQLPNPGVSGPAAGAAGARVHRYSGSAATARLELVDIGDGQYINTLIIDREAPATAVPATRETGTGAQAPKGTHDLLADLNSEMTSGHVPPSELPAHSHNVLMHDYGVLDGADLAVSASMAPGSQKKTLVLAHGYGAALGFFFKNYYALSTVPGYRTIAFDWLGMGNSSRPAFPSKRGSKEVDDRPERAETFFVESLEAWRKAMKLDSFILAGHSLGGYLSVCYALKYPERVEKLILISPVGIPEPPNTTTTADGRVVTVGGGSAPGWAARLWELNVTPFSLIRTLGPWGKGLVERYTYGRLGLEGEGEISGM